jgi:hypothetical protein
VTCTSYYVPGKRIVSASAPNRLPFLVFHFVHVFSCVAELHHSADVPIVLVMSVREPSSHEHPVSAVPASSENFKHGFVRCYFSPSIGTMYTAVDPR